MSRVVSRYAGHLLCASVCSYIVCVCVSVCVFLYRWANHFDPSSPIFKGKQERIEVAISDVALAAVLSGLGWLGQAYGWMWLTKMYIIPYFIVNHW